MNLSVLSQVISDRGLPFVIGDTTQADGNCFPRSIHQNFMFYHKSGRIGADKVPTSYMKIREDVVNYMVLNKESYVGSIEQPGPLSEESFCALIQNIRRDGSYTDLDGYFVEACAKHYNFELHILQTNVDGPIIESGIGGPLIIINKSSVEKMKFYVGFLNNPQDPDGVGHYQFIYKSSPCHANHPHSPLQSPIKLKRSRLVSSYIKSPSPKKKFKGHHCFYCQTVLHSPNELEIHLKDSDKCLQNYQISCKTKDIMAILVASNSCFFCKFTNNVYRISVHLNKNPSCFSKYCRKFHVTTSDQVLRELEKFKRKLHASRSRAKRKLENDRSNKAKKQEKEAKMTKTDCINQYRRETALTNVRHCVICSANMSESRAEEVRKEDLPPELENKMELRRFERFFICLQCKDLKKRPGEIVSKIEMNKFTSGEKTLYIPKMQDEEDSNTSQGPANIQQLSTDLVAFPSTVEALKYVDHKNFKSRSAAVNSIYKVGPIDEQIISIMYENEAFKYHRAQRFGQRFTGVISKPDERLLSSTERVVMDYFIVGSDSWRDIEKRNKVHRLEQFGSIVCSLSIDMPVTCNSLIASSIIQSGTTLTVNFVEGGDGVFETVYLVHNHRANTSCGDSCLTLTLGEFLQQNEQVNTETVQKNHLSCFVSSVQQKLNSFIRNFVKCKVSDFFSEDFSFELEFNASGEISIVGNLWLKELEDLNIEFAKYPGSPISSETVNKSIKLIEEIVTTSSSSSLLKEKFNISMSEGEKLATIAESHQFHHCSDTVCPKCQKPELPSLVTIFVEAPSPDYLLNVETSEEFNKIVLDELTSSSAEIIASLSSEEWLTGTFDALISDPETINDELFRFKIRGKVFDFMIDQRLKDLNIQFSNPVMAVYHYSISCGDISSAFRCVFRRVALKDSYTQPYNIGLLKAFNSRVVIKISNGYEDKKESHISAPMNTDCVADEIASSHNIISTAEAISLFDKQLARSVNSTSVEFVNAVQERKSHFQKVSEISDSTFKDERTGDLFEKLPSNIDRYLDRKNGIPLTLAEFVCHYEYCGKEESRQLIKLLSKPDVDIKASEIRCADSEGEHLPEFIVTKSNDVMKLRTAKKVLAYPRYDDNPSKLEFTKCILFVPITDPIIDEQTISRLLESSDLREEGCSMTKVERNERYYLAYIISLFKIGFIMIAGICSRRRISICKFQSSQRKQTDVTL